MSLLPGEQWQPGDPLDDLDEVWPVQRSEQAYDDGFVAVRVDRVRSPTGEAFERSVVEHRGAVGVLAVDADDRVLSLRQYRHAVGRRLLELPAGICDVRNEPPALTAMRELAEEAGLAAADWRLLLEVTPTPGSSTEQWRIFLARDLRAVARPDGYRAEHEEADMTAVWVPVGDLADAVLHGRITDGMLALAVLALTELRRRGAVADLPAVS